MRDQITKQIMEEVQSSLDEIDIEGMLSDYLDENRMKPQSDTQLETEVYESWEEPLRDDFNSHTGAGHKLGLVTHDHGNVHLHCECGATWSDTTRSLSMMFGVAKALASQRTSLIDEVLEIIGILEGKNAFGMEVISLIKDRIGIYEVMPITEAIKSLILKRSPDIEMKNQNIYLSGFTDCLAELRSKIEALKGGK